MRFLLAILAVLCIVSCSGPAQKQEQGMEVENTPAELVWGLDANKYDVEPMEVKKGDYFGTIMEECGVGASAVPQILSASKNIFDLTRIQQHTNEC